MFVPHLYIYDFIPLKDIIKYEIDDRHFKIFYKMPYPQNDLLGTLDFKLANSSIEEKQYVETLKEFLYETVEYNKSHHKENYKRELETHDEHANKRKKQEKHGNFADVKNTEEKYNLNYCFKCGAKLVEENQKFCIKCGADLSAERKRYDDFVQSKHDDEEAVSDRSYEDCDRDKQSYEDEYDYQSSSEDEEESSVIYDETFGMPRAYIDGNEIRENDWSPPKYLVDDNNYIRESNEFGKAEYYIDGNVIREGGMLGKPKYYIDGDLIREKGPWGRVIGRRK